MQPQNNGMFYIIAGALAAVMFAVIAVLLAGLFNPLVDNDKIFAILGPAFQTIIGCFVGILGSRILGGKDAA